MRIFRAIVVAFTTMSPDLWKAAIAFAVLAITTLGATGFAKTVGTPVGGSTDSSGSPTGSAALMQPCGQSNSNAPAKSMPALIFHEQDAGKTIEVQAGQKITIDLKENPTTGYKWT